MYRIGFLNDLKHFLSSSIANQSLNVSTIPTPTPTPGKENLEGLQFFLGVRTTPYQVRITISQS